MAFVGFGKNSGPSVPPRGLNPFSTSFSSPNPNPNPSPSPTPNPNPPNPNPYLDRNAPVSAHRSLVWQRPQVSPPKPERPSISPNWGNQPKQPVNFPSTTIHKRISPLATKATVYDAGDNFPTKMTSPHAAKRARSPPLSSHEDDILGLYNPANGARRNDVSPLKGGSRRNSPGNAADPAAYQRLFIGNSFSETPGHQRSNIIDASFAAHDTVTPSPPRLDYSTAPKRGRSPPLLATTTSSVLLDSEREMQAKAKRLARFNIELSQPLESLNDHARHKFSGNKQDQAPLAQKKNSKHYAEEVRDTAAMNPLSDYEGLGSSTIVVGLCPDMCPELEREERERKGDLDKFERLDGERHQTSKFLAVKKYNRTAEREADLIRPLPVLQHTVDYLLNLLDQPYDENFLGIYNFLWDRMRAIRMDLRMQHIFNQEAIIMLEQMIRLHIVAMHELCEYKKGEGFSEGFDAHLNIEQMNKASVELFQMYEDHRKKGYCVPTEKEFRGYYALLKLDKHPGYKVEPSELSLDLAKMTPEVRCTPEILFARDVARACRFGNYIAFFRLARKASYLQACLMHAHFAKLRTQALACLHSALTINRGIPISHVVTWLGMEGEDIESLLEYHGFSLRSYDELYMVKEGPFLNSDTEFPTGCSQLVHLKRSGTIVDDVKSCPTSSELTEKRKIETDAIDTVDQQISPSKTNIWANMDDDDEMFAYKTDSAPRTVMQSRQLYEGPPSAMWNRETDQKIAEGSFPIWNINNREAETSVAIWNKAHDHEMELVSLEGATPLTDESVSDKKKHADKGTAGFAGQVGLTFMDGPASPKPEKCIVQAGVTASTSFDSVVAICIPQRDVENLFPENEASMLVSHQNDEAFKEKLKVLIRKWRKRSSMLREIREQKAFLANAALSSLSLGPPIRRQTEIQPGNASGEVNIDFVARERYTRQRTSWARLNVSELVAPILSARNPVAKCLCWKIVLLVQENSTEDQTYNLALRWLVSKLMGTGMRSDDELVVSLPGISIWKKCTGTRFSLSQTCCLSVIRETRLDNNQSVYGEDIVAGSSCFLFLVSNSIPWEIQKLRLRKVLAAMPSGSSLPLLILNSDSCDRDTADPSVTIMSRLGLHEADETRISSSSVTFLTGSSDSGHVNCFFDDDQLREGLMWLANHSPIQPTVHLVKIREKVLSYLRHSTEALEHLEATEVTPDHCISAFNEALDNASDEIVVAASANTTNWPSPELDLLDKLSNEQLIADMNLPSIGWSSAARIKSIVDSIKSCSLPGFPNDMSWLSKDFPPVMEIQNQKLAIEECLSNYLTQSTRLLDADLASREASIMLQQGAGIELRSSGHHIVPRWLMIFQRIYNWQLMRLTGKGISEAYVLDRTEAMDLSLTNPLQRDLCFEDYRPQTRLSLDELVVLSSGQRLLPPESIYKVCFAAEANTDSREESGEDLRGGNFSSNVSSAISISEQSQMSMPDTNPSRLDMLYKQCSQLQDTIDRELAIFF